MPRAPVHSPRVGEEKPSGRLRLSVLPSSKPAMPFPPVHSPRTEEETPTGPWLSVLPSSESQQQQPRVGSVHLLMRILTFGLFCESNASRSPCIHFSTDTQMFEGLLWFGRTTAVPSSDARCST